jgi:hypothetical protein
MADQNFAMEGKSTIREFGCKACCRAYHSFDDLFQHLESHHLEADGRVLKCEDCGTRRKTPEGLHRHLLEEVTHMRTSVFRNFQHAINAGLSPSEAEKHAYRAKHKRNSQGPLLGMCIESATMDLLNAGLANPALAGRYLCGPCRIVFARPSELAVHLGFAAPQHQINTCGDCKHQFNSRFGLIEHFGQEPGHMRIGAQHAQDPTHGRLSKEIEFPSNLPRADLPNVAGVADGNRFEVQGLKNPKGGKQKLAPLQLSSLSAFFAIDLAVAQEHVGHDLGYALSSTGIIVEDGLQEESEEEVVELGEHEWEIKSESDPGADAIGSTFDRNSAEHVFHEEDLPAMRSNGRADSDQRLNMDIEWARDDEEVEQCGRRNSDAVIHVGRSTSASTPPAKSTAQSSPTFSTSRTVPTFEVAGKASSVYDTSESESSPMDIISSSDDD